MSNETPLNTSTAGYNAIAIMLGYAFDYADRIMRSSGNERQAKRFELGVAILTRPDLIAEYIDEHASDRRYKIRWHASTDSSAIITYRGRRYHVEGRWNSQAQLRYHYIYNA